MNKRRLALLGIAMIVCTYIGLAFAAEVRKGGANDLSFATPNQGAATTWSSGGGATVTYIDAAHIPFRNYNAYVDDLVDGGYDVDIKPANITGDGTDSITGFNIPLYVNANLSLLDAVTAWRDVRSDGTDQTAVNTAVTTAEGDSTHTVLIPNGVTGIPSSAYATNRWYPLTNEFSFWDLRTGATGDMVTDGADFAYPNQSTWKNYKFVHYVSTDSLPTQGDRRHVYETVMNVEDGGVFTASNKSDYAIHYGSLMSHDAGQLEGFVLDGDNFGKGDTVGFGGTYRAYGSGETSGESGNPKFTETYIEQGYYIASGTVSSETGGVVTITSPNSLEFLGRQGRFCVNTSNTYTTGTVTATLNSATITGSGTSWDSNMVGKYFKVNLDDSAAMESTAGMWYRITAVDNATSLTIWTVYEGANAGSSLAYTIADGGVVTDYSLSGNTITLTKGGTSSFENGDTLECPPHSDVKIDGAVFGMSPRYDSKLKTHTGVSVQNKGAGRLYAGIQLVQGSGNTASVDFNTGILFGASTSFDTGIDFSNTTINNYAVKYGENQTVFWAAETPGKYIYQAIDNGTGNLEWRNGSNANALEITDTPGIKVGSGTEIQKLTWNATATVDDGGTVTHGMGTTPTAVLCTSSVAGEMCSVTAIGATTFTVALKTHAGAAGTQQTVYWLALK